MAYIQGEGKRSYPVFVVKMINAVLDYLVASFFEGAAYPEPVLVKVKK